MTQFASVYCHGTGSFFPNEPVDNERIEDVLGRIGGEPSRARRKILKSNGIRSRHYAIDPETKQPSHSNTQLTAEAVRNLVATYGLDLDALDLIACGTTTPDQLMPNQASMLHGELGCAPCEVVATSGACLAGLTSWKYAALSVAGGAKHALATGSELTSAVMRAQSFPDGETPVEKLQEDPIFAFGQDFLRWMLSDAAGAVWLTDAPHPDRLSLRLDWIDTVSFANELETCMYWGAKKQDDGSMRGWLQAETVDQALASGMMNFTQDARLLGRQVGPSLLSRGLRTVLERNPVRAEEIDWFLPHYSSEYFRQEVYDRFRGEGFEIPFERWAANLTTRGNVGSAAIYVMLDELLRSGELQPGQRIFGLVPESARFSVGYLLMTVVEPEG